jgi:hypothetical protein
VSYPDTLVGTERFDLVLGELTRPRQPGNLRIEPGTADASVPPLLRIDTPSEAAHVLAGGIMPHVLEHC